MDHKSINKNLAGDGTINGMGSLDLNKYQNAGTGDEYYGGFCSPLKFQFFTDVMEDVIRPEVDSKKLIAQKKNNGDIKLVDVMTDEDRSVCFAKLQSLDVGDLSKIDLDLLLCHCNWNPFHAAKLYKELMDAGNGILVQLPDPSITLKGAVNGGNTCYLDSLLFAMFAQIDAFDWLLLKNLSDSDSLEVQLLQLHLCFFINQLRSGHLVSCHIANLVRRYLVACGWGKHSDSVNPLHDQQDASELYCFLLELFRSPSLPINEKLFHGGKNDPRDSKLAGERVLHLSLPQNKDNSRSAITLEKVLRYNLFDSRVDRLRRQVSGEFSECQVEAWRQVLLMPFYTLDEPKDPYDDLSESLRQSRRVMLPMVLKRYQARPNSAIYARNMQPVVIPQKMDFTDFVDENFACTGDFVLVLRSIVCHQGEKSINSGHYIAAASKISTSHRTGRCIDDPWLLFDDLSMSGVNHKSSCVSDISKSKDLYNLFGKELSTGAYMLFYELIDERGSNMRDVLKRLGESTDLALARRLQAEEEHSCDNHMHKICSIS